MQPTELEKKYIKYIHPTLARTHTRLHSSRERGVCLTNPLKALMSGILFLDRFIIKPCYGRCSLYEPVGSLHRLMYVFYLLVFLGRYMKKQIYDRQDLLKKKKK